MTSLANNNGVTSFDLVADAAVDRAGNVFVAGGDNDTICEITPANALTIFSGAFRASGSADGFAPARFNRPEGIAIDAAGNLYVADTDNHTIRKITPDGLASTLAGAAGQAGSADGTGADARFSSPNDVAVDAAGNVYVADSGNAAIRRITPAGVTTTLAGSPARPIDVLGTAPSFARPQNLAIVGDSLAITDSNAVLLFRHVVR